VDGLPWPSPPPVDRDRVGPIECALDSQAWDQLALVYELPGDGDQDTVAVEMTRYRP